MAYEICKICGRFFQKNGRQYCDTCYEKDKEDYALVREYVVTHRGASAMEVSRAVGIPLKTIFRYIEEERINIDKKIIIKNEGWKYGS